MDKIKRQPSHPGEVLKEEFLEQLEISQTQLAEDLNIPLRVVNELINEKRRLNSEIALRLSRYFGTTAELWLNLQNQYDIYFVLLDKGKEISKVRHFKESA